MEAQMIVLLPVIDLDRSNKFYSSIGFVLDPRYSDVNGNCMVYKDVLALFLLESNRFSSLAKKPLGDFSNFTSVLLTLHVENYNKVNEIVELALQSGGKESLDFRDYGFLKVRTVEDPDGHTWKVLSIDNTFIF